MSSKSPLRQLADLISEAVDSIDAHFSKHNTSYPDLNAPFHHDSKEEALATDPAIDRSSQVLVGACDQLSALVDRPGNTLFRISAGFHLSSALRAAIEGNVTEILRDYPEGAHCKDIAAKNGMDPGRLARILRILATHHTFIEVAPDTFKNNRLSSMSDTLKSLEEIQSDPANKHIHTSGIAAAYEHTTEEVFKSSAYLTDVLLDKTAGHSDDTRFTPFSRAFNTDKHFFEWLEEKSNEGRLKRFAAAMEGTVRMDAPNALVTGFNWKSLPNGSTIVDVGGGRGHTVLKIRKDFPSFKYVVQDRLQVINEARDFWMHNSPDAVNSGNVSLQGYNFFEEQPVKNADVYMMRMIIHDFGESQALKILKRQREAASSQSRLLLIERVLPYAAPYDSFKEHVKGIKGAAEPSAPSPLLPNYGASTPYLSDMQMLSLIFGEERTLGGFIDLLAQAQWKLIEVFHVEGSQHKHILAAPF